MASGTGCVCRLGPDCPRPGRCDDSAIAELAASQERMDRRLAGQLDAEQWIRDREWAAVELAAEFGTDISEWTV